MAFVLRFAPEAAEALRDLGSARDKKQLNRVRNALGLLQTDPKYPSLHSHKYRSTKGLNDEDVWDSYVENHTPGAWRIFWCYGPDADTITILTVGPHPD